ncbi:hypothetical protein ABBQ32_004493 [Trebouxia sp. C0010 RCD-2024]
MPKTQGTAMPQGPQSLGDTGWTRKNVYNVPNAISMARLASGPVIAWLVLSEQWGVALVSLAISGASDWADGYMAKRYNQSSVLGSYLDPLADKALIGCVVGALGYQGSLPGALVALIIGRDVVLLSGAFVHRFRAVGWRWPGFAEFFRVSSATSSSSPGGIQPATPDQPASSTGFDHRGSTSAKDTQDARHVSMVTDAATVNPAGVIQQGLNEPQTGQAAEGKGSIPPAVFVQPLYISKVNTCFQLLLVGGCLSSSWYAWPLQEAILVLGAVTGSLTLASCAAYVRVFFKGNVK